MPIIDLNRTLTDLESGRPLKKQLSQEELLEIRDDIMSDIENMIDDGIMEKEEKEGQFEKTFKVAVKSKTLDLTLKTVCLQSVMSSTADSNEALERMMVALKIKNAPVAGVDLSSDEVTKIKELIGRTFCEVEKDERGKITVRRPYPMVCGQAGLMLEGKL